MDAGKGLNHLGEVLFGEIRATGDDKFYYNLAGLVFHLNNASDPFAYAAFLFNRAGMRGEFAVVGGQHAAIAKAAQVLGREEAETTNGSDAPSAQSITFGADGLRGVV